MSLHKFAEQVAANGRGEDSLLVHMTPDEVRKLQQFAEANGTTLTINPETGLPEAGLLSDLFKTVAPIALGAFLGPAGAAFGGGLMSAGMAGLTVGGLTTLATGSLSRGLMAGLGAYGGAGLGESLMGAGTGALEAGAASAAQGQLGAAQLALGEALPEQAAAQFTKDAATRQLASATPWDKMGAGLSSITSSPSAAGAFAKDNWKSLAAAAAPIMAGAMVPTTTKMPENTNPAYIRQKLYDPYTQTYKSLTPVKASEWGSRSFSDAYTNPQTGIAAVLDERKPTPMAGGGIVALAAGGPPPKMLTDEQLYQASGLTGQAGWEAAAKARDAQNVALSHYNAINNPTVGANINQWIVDNPFATAADINTAITKAGLTQDIVNPYLTDNKNISAATRYALSHANEMPGAGGLAGMQANILKGFAAPNLTQAQIDTEQRKYGISDADIQSPLTHGYQIADTDLAKATNYLQSNPDVQAWLSSAEGRDYIRQHPEFDASDIAYTHYMRYGKGEGRTWEEATKKPIVCGPGYRLNAAGTACEPIPVTPPPPPFSEVTPTGFYGNNTGNPLTSTPGDIASNPDGTVTVQPNIPGRPDGGFPGMASVRDAYTAGGGSLGYTAKAPRTIDEFNQMYNRQTGDSLAAYDYLMGKGGGKYPVQSKAAATGINRPYWGEGMRYKPKFLSYDKEGNTVSSTANPNAPKSGDAKVVDLTKAKTIEVTDYYGESPQIYTAVLQEDGTYLAGNGKRYDVTGKELAADGGMMGYAMGGGLGSLGSYSDGGRLLKGPGDGVSDSIPATIGAKRQPARLADGEFVIPARIVSELGNGSTEAGAKKLYAMMDRVQKARGKTTGKNKVAANSRADKYLPA